MVLLLRWPPGLRLDSRPVRGRTVTVKWAHSREGPGYRASTRTWAGGPGVRLRLRLASRGGRGLTSSESDTVTVTVARPGSDPAARNRSGQAPGAPPIKLERSDETSQKSPKAIHSRFRSNHDGLGVSGRLTKFTHTNISNLKVRVCVSCRRS